MKLADYLTGTMKANETLDERNTRFARQLGVSMHAVRKWLYRQRRISDAMKIRIEQVTGGKVKVDELVRG